jgi:hypothetical protein
MTTLQLVLVAAAGVLAGVVAALKVIAPKTANTVDDKILEVAEQAENFVDPLVK